MNKFTLIAALAASLAGLASVPAAAQDVSISVAYRDLDVSSAAGAQVLAQRFYAGVDSACARPDIRDVKAMTLFTECKNAAVSSATQQLSQAGATVDAARLLS